MGLVKFDGMVRQQALEVSHHTLRPHARPRQRRGTGLHARLILDVVPGCGHFRAGSLAGWGTPTTTTTTTTATAAAAAGVARTAPGS